MKRTRCGQDDRDRVEESLQALIRVDIIEEMRENAWDQQVSNAERERGSKHEAIPAREMEVREHSDSRDDDAREQECRHAARTELGMARKTPEILPMMPKRRRKTQHQRPAWRFAHRVIAMTPLF